MVGDSGAVIFIREYAGLGSGETNRKAGSGWGRFRVQKPATLTSSAPDDGLMRPKHVELRKLQ